MGNVQEMIDLAQLRVDARAAAEQAKQAWSTYAISAKATATAAKDAKDSANEAHKASMALQNAMVENAKAKAAAAAKDVARTVADQKARKADTPPAPKAKPVAAATGLKSTNGSKRPTPNAKPAPSKGAAANQSASVVAPASAPTKKLKQVNPKDQKYRLTDPTVLRKGEVQDYARTAAKLKVFTREQFTNAMIKAGKDPKAVRVKVNHCVRFKVFEVVGADA